MSPRRRSHGRVVATLTARAPKHPFAYVYAIATISNGGAQVASEGIRWPSPSTHPSLALTAT